MLLKSHNLFVSYKFFTSQVAKLYAWFLTSYRLEWSAPNGSVSMLHLIVRFFILNPDVRSSHSPPSCKACQIIVSNLLLLAASLGGVAGAVRLVS